MIELIFFIYIIFIYNLFLLKYFKLYYFIYIFMNNYKEYYKFLLEKNIQKIKKIYKFSKNNDNEKTREKLIRYINKAEYYLILYHMN